MRSHLLRNLYLHSVCGDTSTNYSVQMYSAIVDSYDSREHSFETNLLYFLWIKYDKYTLILLPLCVQPYIRMGSDSQ